MPKTYNTSVWRNTWETIKPTASQKGRLMFESLLSIGVSFALIEGFDAQKALVAALVIPLFLVIHFLWSLATAPRRLYYEQQWQIEELIAESARLREGFTEKPELRIEYEPDRHYTRHPNGSVQIRLLLKNVGKTEAKTIRVRIESLVPKTNKKEASPYSTQFNARRLEVVARQPGFSLQSEDSAEILLIHADQGDDFFKINALDNDENPTVYRTKKARYEITVVATAKNGGTAIGRFVAFPRNNGELGFKVADL